MPQFLPFRGLRYHPERLGADATDFGPLVAPPYDVIDDDERAALLARDAHNAVRLILPGDTPTTDPYQAAADDLRAWIDAGVLAADGASAFYGYRMRFRDDRGAARTTTGVIGALGLEAPGDGILPHERTLAKAKSDRLALLTATRANLDPIWGLSLRAGLTGLLQPNGGSLGGCRDDHGVEHEIFAITDAERIAAISQAVGADQVVLADGHHRFETALEYQRTVDASADAIMCFVVELADDQLFVQPIHRLLQLPDGTDFRALLTGLGALDEVDDLDRARDRITDHQMVVVDQQGSAIFTPASTHVAAALADVPEPLRHVDSALVEGLVVPALPPHTEVTYRNDAQTCAALVEKGAADAALMLRPVTVGQIRDAAFGHLRMPQKTTFFEPKPRTGLVFRLLDLSPPPLAQNRSL